MFLCVHVDTHVSWFMCRGQRATSVSIITFYLVWDKIFFTRLPGPWALGEFSVSAAYFTVGVLGLQTQATAHGFTWVLGSELCSSCLCGKQFIRWAFSPVLAYFCGIFICMLRLLYSFLIYLIIFHTTYFDHVFPSPNSFPTSLPIQLYVFFSLLKKKTYHKWDVGSACL